MVFIDNLLSKFAPHVCLGCGQEGTLLCLACGDVLSDPAVHPADGSLETVRSVTVYEGFAMDLVWHLKFRGAQAAATIMARHMVPLIGRESGRPVIIPVPTATRRVRQRGFDQAKLLAKQLSRQTGMQYLDCLRRYGQTHQVGAGRQERLRQLKDAYGLKKKPDLGSRPAVLVDDVITTGATLEAAASVIRAAGACRVDAVVFAQT